MKRERERETKKGWVGLGEGERYKEGERRDLERHRDKEVTRLGEGKRDKDG